jgi:hypothetical protein
MDSIGLKSRKRIQVEEWMGTISPTPRGKYRHFHITRSPFYLRKYRGPSFMQGSIIRRTLQDSMIQKGVLPPRERTSGKKKVTSYLLPYPFVLERKAIRPAERLLCEHVHSNGRVLIPAPVVRNLFE